MNFNQDIENLIYAYIRGTLTSEERAKLDVWLQEPCNRLLFDRICDKKNILTKFEFFERFPRDKGWIALEHRINKRIDASKNINKKNLLIRRWLYVASVVLPLVFSIWFIANNDKNAVQFEEQSLILPGVSCAQLKLAGGEIIALREDTLYSLNLPDGGQFENASGVLVCKYDSAGMDMGEYDEIVTPKGGEYRVILSDGTKIWLNAESKLRFPRVFAGDERRVYVSGELYFEVARDTDTPFYVEIDNGYTVEVVGTEFNVRSYSGEPCATTLVKGGVAIHSGEKSLRLNPGEEAVMEKNKGISICKAKVDARIAWRNGYFLFDNERMEDIMQELARWYDVDVFFESQTIRNERFSVELCRHDDFRHILDLIEKTGMVTINVKGKVVFIK